MPQLQLQDSLGLGLTQLEPLHQDFLWFFFLADDLDDGINIQIGNQQSVEDMQAFNDPIESKLKPPLDGRQPKFQPLLESALEIKHFRPAVESDHIHVDPVTLLERGGGKKVIHQGSFIDPVGSGFNNDPGGVLVI